MDKFIAIGGEGGYFCGFDEGGVPILEGHPVGAMKFAHRDEVGRYLGSLPVEQAGLLVSGFKMVEIIRKVEPEEPPPGFPPAKHRGHDATPPDPAHAEALARWHEVVAVHRANHGPDWHRKIDAIHRAAMARARTPDDPVAPGPDADTPVGDNQGG